MVDDNSLMSILKSIDNIPLLVSSIPGIVASAVSDGIVVKTPRFIRLESCSFNFPQIWRCYVLWNAIWTLFILIPLLLSSLGVSHPYSATSLRAESAIKHANFMSLPMTLLA